MNYIHISMYVHKGVSPSWAGTIDLKSFFSRESLCRSYKCPVARRDLTTETPQMLQNFPLCPCGDPYSLHTATEDITYTSPRISILIHALASINWHCSEDSIDFKLVYFPLSIWDLVLRLHKHKENKSP